MFDKKTKNKNNVSLTSQNETVFQGLMLKAQNGDSQAYRELLSQLSFFLKNYLNKRIFERNDKDEVIQEVLLALHKSLHTYDKNRLFMGWLMSIVEYKVTDYIRAHQKIKSTKSLDDISYEMEQVFSQSDLKLDIEKALSRLSLKERGVLTELKIKGQSISEVATSLNLSEANVKVIAHRAYLNLRKQLESGT